MKIPPANPLPARPSPEINRASAARRGPVQATASSADEPADTAESHAATSERDFASVLEEVSRPEQRQDDTGEGDRRDARQSERTEHEGEARRHEDREGGEANTGGGGKGGGFEQRASLREAVSMGDATGARAILHIADLERIVSAVRSQIVAGVRQEVTIELRRSVLEGLRVKLSADAGGRITAEFIAATERVRSQLDARTAELSELLRARGINLASMTTSVDSGAGSTGERGRGGDDISPHAAAARPAGAADASAARADAAAGDDEGGASSTYRA